MKLVMDASCGIGFLMPDEQDTVSLAALKAMKAGAETWVAAHWAVEVSNMLRHAEPKRITAAQSAALCAHALALESEVHVDTETYRRAFSETLQLAKTHNLTVYDAAYLELAMRKGATLATKDKDLVKASKASGVLLL